MMDFNIKITDIGLKANRKLNNDTFFHLLHVNNLIDWKWTIFFLELRVPVFGMIDI